MIQAGRDLGSSGGKRTKQSFRIVGGVVVIALVIVGVLEWQRVTASAAGGHARTQSVAVTRGTLVASGNAAGNVSAPSTAALTF